MWDRLEFVSLKDMQDAMIKANIPGAGTIGWKIDLITLAIRHDFNYIIPTRRLVKPNASIPIAAIPVQPITFAAIPVQPVLAVFQGAHNPPSPQARREMPSPTGPQAVHALEKMQKLIEAERSAASDVPATRKRLSEPVAASQSLHSEDGMGVAGTLKQLYEAKWLQVFAPAQLTRGYMFPGTWTFEEIRLEIARMALESGCVFWKTDTGTTDSQDGYIHSMSFKCPHYPDPAYYTEKKGRKNPDDAAEPWRNETRNGLHVTGTKCGARFTINGKKSDVDGKFVWRISPLIRAKFSMEHSGHPEPYAKYLQKMVLSIQEKATITTMVNAGMASNQISAFLSENGQKGAISKQTIGFISSEIAKWDTELSIIRAKAPGVSAAQALVQNLQALPNCTVVLLYKDKNHRASLYPHAFVLPLM